MINFRIIFYQTCYWINTKIYAPPPPPRHRLRSPVPLPGLVPPGAKICPASAQSRRRLRSPAPHRLGVALPRRRLHSSVLHRPCVSPPDAKTCPGVPLTRRRLCPIPLARSHVALVHVSITLKICHRLICQQGFNHPFMPPAIFSDDRLPFCHRTTTVVCHQNSELSHILIKVKV